MSIDSAQGIQSGRRLLSVAVIGLLHVSIATAADKAASTDVRVDGYGGNAHGTGDIRTDTDTNATTATTTTTADTAVIPEPATERLSIAQIETRLATARADDSYYISDFKTTDVGYATADVAPVSLLNTPTEPIGLDSTAITQIPTPSNTETLGIGDDTNKQSETATAGIDPTGYLPSYTDGEQTETQPSDTTDNTTIKQPNLVKRLYNRLFSDGAVSLPRLDISIYQLTSTDGANAQETKVDDKIEPYGNIKAALGDITQESAQDFRTAAPRLRETAEAAARAVGYYDMDFRLINEGNGKIKVLINSLGEPVKVTSQVVDIRGDGADNALFVKAKETALPKVGEVFDHGQYTQSKADIDEIKWEHGFFEGQWLNSSVDVLLPDNTADVNLVYDTGEQYSFDDVVFFTIDPQTRELTADPDKLPVKLELLHKMVNFRVGEPFDRNKVNTLSNELLTTGYFNASNVETVLPSPPSAEDDNSGDNSGINFEASSGTPANDTNNNTNDETSTITLDEAAGITATISPIDFSPSQAILERLNLVSAKAERLYNSPADRVLDAKTATGPTSLLGKVSNAVSNIVRAILPDESKDELSEGAVAPTLAGRKTANEVYDDKKVPLYVFVMADKPRNAELGIGYGTDTGVRATTRFEHHLVNRDGYQLGVQTSVSGINKAATAYVSRPLTHPNDDKLVANITYKEEKIDQGTGAYELSNRTVQTMLARKIERDSGWNQTYSVRYRLDALETNAPRSTWVDLPVQFAENRPVQEAILAGFTLSKTIQNHLTNPTRGYRQYYSLEAGSRAVMTDTNMVIARAGVSGLYGFGNNAYGKDRAHQLIGKLDAGYIWADDFNNVPYKLRFFAGGDQSLRGYNYESLSPVSAAGYLVGGQALAIGSVEYSYEVREGLRAAVFADIGNAYDKDFSNDTKIGAGVGVRWASPVGTVRVDVAKGVGEPNTSIKLHFMIGMPF
ncbi:MAG: BamA/TamA family outer membrane protein [Moraxella sp.]|nr:BamA/TamA family outer membrane protein [Moraxella sp.]